MTDTLVSMDAALHQIAREITDEMFPAITLQHGHRYHHPEHGVIEITGGMYRDPRSGRISNAWTWTDVGGAEHHGYGANWPPAD